MSTYLNTLEVQGMTNTVMLEQLDEIFPPVTPNPTDTIEAIMYKAGQRCVVEWIKQFMEK